MKTHRADRDIRLALVSQLAESGAIATPGFIFDETELARILHLFSKHLPFVQLFYAMKANPFPLLLRYFAGRGLGFDVASAYEAKQVREICGPDVPLVLSNPIKDGRALQALFRGDILSYTFDNELELNKINEYRRKSGFVAVPESIVRIRIESSGVQIDLNEKFGCSLKEAVELVELAHKQGLRPSGVQFHVGTQSLSAQNFALGIESAMFIARAVRRNAGIELKTINIGGGFPDPHLAERNNLDIEEIFAEVGEACRLAHAAGFALVAEPGRVLVSSAATFVTRVIGIHERNGVRWVYLDDGAYGAYSGRFFDHKTFEFHAVPVSGRDLTADERIHCVVAGPTCDAIDVVSDRCLLPENLRVGDLLCSFNMGAYSNATTSRFNGYGEHSALLARLEVGVARVLGEESALALVA